MSKIKLLVEIDENKYRHITEMPNVYASEVCKVIRNGTPYNPTGDLISREALKKDIEAERHSLLVRGQIGAEHILVHHCLPIIDNAPTATERPHGEWIHYLGCGIGKAVCSECGQIGETKKYCGSCGADMRKGGTE